MLLANQTFYLASFSILLGLIATFVFWKSEEKVRYSSLYWPLALALFSISSLSFFIAPWIGSPALVVANLSLVSGVISISMLFHAWNNSLNAKQKKLAIVFLLGTACIYLFLLNSATVQSRIHLINTVLALLSLEQIITLSKVMKKDKAHLIQILIGVLLLQIASRVARSALLLVNSNTDFSNLYQEDIVGFSLRVFSFSSIIIICILIANYLLQKLSEMHKKSALAIEDGMFNSLSALSMARDNETGNHILRTKKYVQCLANRLKEMGIYVNELSTDAISNMVKASPLHDIGKVGIPDGILKKNTRLSPQEWEVMKTHAILGESVLISARIDDAKHTDILDFAIQMAGSHHENWDGTGYPKGLRGLEIPLAARVMSLADMYDALVTERVYKSKWSHQDACAEILKLKGTRFDPAVVDAFLLEHEIFNDIAQKYHDVIV